MNKLMEQNSRLLNQKDEKIGELEDTNLNIKKHLQSKFKKYEKLMKEYKLKVEKIAQLEKEKNYINYEFV